MKKPTSCTTHARLPVCIAVLAAGLLAWGTASAGGGGPCGPAHPTGLVADNGGYEGIIFGGGRTGGRGDASTAMVADNGDYEGIIFRSGRTSGRGDASTGMVADNGGYEGIIFGGGRRPCR